MSVLSVLFIVFISIFFALMILFAIMTGRPLKALFLNFLSGIILLVIICLLEKYLFTGLRLNIYTLSVSGFLGIPGVIMQLLIKILFI